MRTAVIVCTYNGEKFISEELESIINQTKTLDKIFISDDMSKDRTAEILKSYKEKYPELIDLSINKINLGYRKNFETVLQKAKDFDIIFFADQDDIWEPNKVEVITKEFEANENLVLAFSDANVVNENLDETGKTLFRIFLPSKRRKILNKIPEEILTAGSTVTGCTMAISNEIIKFITPFSENYVHDEWIAAIAIFFGEVKAIDTPLIKYRLHESQAVGIGNATRKKIDEWIYKLVNEFSADDEIEKINKQIQKNLELENYLLTLGKESEILEKKNVFLQNKIKAYSRSFIYRFFFVIKNYLNGNYQKNCFNMAAAVKDIYLHKKS